MSRTLAISWQNDEKNLRIRGKSNIASSVAHNIYVHQASVEAKVPVFGKQICHFMNEVK
jgi:hypothetical protein